MLGSLMMLASACSVILPNSASSSSMRCSFVSLSGKFAMIRPASEMSFSRIVTPAAPTKASTIGNRENVASPGASSTFVQTISSSDNALPLGSLGRLERRDLSGHASQVRGPLGKSRTYAFGGLARGRLSPQFGRQRAASDGTPSRFDQSRNLKVDCLSSEGAVIGDLREASVTAPQTDRAHTA